MPSSRRSTALAVLLSFALLTTFALACDEAGTTSPADRDGSGVTSIPLTPLADRFLPLPHTDTVTSGVPAFEIKQKGGGIAGRFEITNPNSAAIALDGVSGGTGHALLAWNLGRGRGAVVITSNSTNTLSALEVSSQSVGAPPSGTNPGTATAARIESFNTNSTAPAVTIGTMGKGPALVVNHKGTAGSLGNFQVAGVAKVRFARNGKGFFNGGTQTGGADVAEAFRVEGRTRDYRPGDVLIISDESDRRVERSDEAYSTRVIGVHATKPGVLLTDRDINAGLKGHVPVGVIGVIPTKVSGENGPIRRGDLLVTATTAGHAMRGTDRERMFGAVIGKALAEFTERGTGVIPVLVSLK